jgi:alpha-mannosidase
MQVEILYGGKNREDELDEAWKNLLLAQHHDIQIVGLLSDALKLLPVSIKKSEKIIASSMAFFADNMSDKGIKHVVVFNPHSWSQERWITTEVSLTKGEARSFQVRHNDVILQSLIISSDEYSDKSIMRARIAFKADLKPLSIMSFSLNPIKDLAYSNSSNIRYEDKVIKTPLLELKLSDKGGFEYLKDLRSNTFVNNIEIDRTALFAGTIGGEQVESNGKWIIDQSDPNAPWISATEYGFIADIPYKYKIKIYEDSPVIECKVIFEFNGQKIGLLSDNERDSHSPFIHDKKLRFKFHPQISQNTYGIRDLPFAISETANKYIEGNYWTAISDNTYGVAIFNKGAMGTVREEDGSISIPLAYAMYYIWGTRMLHGDYTYEFAIYPFSGVWQEADIHRKSIVYNFPFPQIESTEKIGTIKNDVNILNIKEKNVILSALYPRSGKLYVRFYEYNGSNADFRIQLDSRISKLIEVDLMENELKNTTTGFRPWEIKTYNMLTQ